MVCGGGRHRPKTSVIHKRGDGPMLQSWHKPCTLGSPSNRWFSKAIAHIGQSERTLTSPKRPGRACSRLDLLYVTLAVASRRASARNVDRDRPAGQDDHRATWPRSVPQEPSGDSSRRGGSCGTGPEADTTPPSSPSPDRRRRRAAELTVCTPPEALYQNSATPACSENARPSSVNRPEAKSSGCRRSTTATHSGHARPRPARSARLRSASPLQRSQVSARRRHHRRWPASSQRREHQIDASSGRRSAPPHPECAAVAATAVNPSRPRAGTVERSVG